MRLVSAPLNQRIRLTKQPALDLLIERSRNEQRMKELKEMLGWERLL